MAIVRRPPTPSNGHSLLRSYKIYIPLIVMVVGLCVYKPDLTVGSIPDTATITATGSIRPVINPNPHEDDEEGVRPRLGAYYYTGYNEEVWKERKTKLTPELGFYDSKNSTVLSRHANWATRAGIDFMILSYFNNIDEITTYMQHNDTLPIVLNIESLELYKDSVKRYMKKTKGDDKGFEYNGFIDFNAPAISVYKPNKITTFSEIFQEALFKGMSEIFKKFRPKYTKVSNRPIFLVYLARDFINYEHHIKVTRNKFTKKYNMQPYLIADSVWFADDANKKMTHDKYAGSTWDSLTSFDRYEGKWGEDLPTYMQRVEHEFETYSKVTSFNSWFWEKPNKRMTMLPYVQPMYDDLLIHKRDVAPGNGTRTVHEYDEGKTYLKFWELAKRILDRNPCEDMHTDEHFVFISSFNEWHQSTAIEPSKEHGNHLVFLTRERSRYMDMQCDMSAIRQKPHLKSKHEV